MTRAKAAFTDPDLATATGLLDAAAADYRDADGRCAYYGLRALALTVKHEWPKATTFVLDWSDQGDYLMFSNVEESGRAQDWDDTDPYGIAGWLCPANEGIWGRFAAQPPHPGRSRGESSYTFDLAAVLSGTAKPYADFLKNEDGDDQ